MEQSAQPKPPAILFEMFETIKSITKAANEIIPELRDETKPNIRMGTLLTTELGKDSHLEFTKIGAAFLSLARPPRQILFERVNIEECKKGDYRISISPFGAIDRALMHYMYVSENQGSSPEAWVVGGDEARKAERKERKAAKKGQVLPPKPEQTVVVPISSMGPDRTVAIVATILKALKADFVAYAPAVTHHFRSSGEAQPDTPGATAQRGQVLTLTR